MEYVEGLDLAKMVKTKRPLPIAHACYFIHQAALGLQHAHERGMVHRDVKPANLIIASEGKKSVVKVLDFGLAKVTSEGQVDSGLTREGQMLGTPDYIAPEQIRNAQSTEIRADIYSLGCTFYHLLTGGPPFHGDSLWDLYQAHFSMDAGPLNLVRPEVPVELAALVAKMMAKEPDKRFQTPGEVAQALTRFFKPAAPQPLGSAAEISRIDPLVPPTQTSGAGPMSAQPATSVTIPNPSVRKSSKSGTDGVAWESLIEFKEDEPLMNVVKPKAAEPKPSPTEVPVRRPVWVWPAVAAGVLMLGLIAAWMGGVFKVKTPDGVIVLENVPEDAEILVDGGKINVKWPGAGEPLEIRAVPGQRTMSVRKDGLTTFGEVVTVKAAESVEVTVRLDPVVRAEAAGHTSNEPARQQVVDAAPALGGKAEIVGGRWLVEGRELVQTEAADGRLGKILFGDFG
jgi:hypothetical protein